MGYRIVNGKLHFAQDLSQAYSSTKSNSRKNVSSEKSFKDTFDSEIKKSQGFTISNHAAERLKSRKINLNEEDMKNIDSALDRAENKGCSESALLYKNTVLIASIKNRTVITALGKDESNGGIFTNIDSMVIV